MLKAFQGQAPGGISITIEEWLRLTDLGALSRRTEEMRAIDDALRAYHQAKGGEAAFIRLKNAFDNWIRFQQRQGKTWTQSDRNKNGAITRLHDQITLVEAGRGVGGMGALDEARARTLIIRAEREALQTLFKDRTMIFKHTTSVKQGLGAIASPAARYGSAVHKIVDGAGMTAVKPKDIGDACTKILGKTPPDELFHSLGTSFSGFCSAGATILGAAVSPAKLLADIIKFGMAANARYSAATARYMFRDGAPDAALNAVLQLIDNELKKIAYDAAKQTASIVGGAFGVGPIVSMASALVDLMINLTLYCDMLDEMKAANQLLAQKTLGLELFNASPVLGCYFLLMADTSTWINFSAYDIGSPHWMDAVEAMRKRAEPVRDKARELIRGAKIALSGTEFFNGLEWETTWRNNKLSYLAANASVSGLAGTLGRKLQGSGAPKFTKPDASRIVGFGSGG
ncbi:MAG TPA: hypothetical protein VGM25_03200 [Caulobacteraceae bacterium]